MILIIAKDDRRLRLEVGYGLEGVLPDTVANRIINSIIEPHLKKGDFYTGIKNGLAAILKVIQGEKLPEAAQISSWRKGREAKNYPYYMLFFLAFIFAKILRSFLGATVSSIAVIIMSIFLGFLFVNWIGGLIVGVIASIFSGAFGGAMVTGGTRYYGGGSFGGGFSGGGGGFGGGGSSGSW